MRFTKATGPLRFGVAIALAVIATAQDTTKVEAEAAAVPGAEGIAEVDLKPGDLAPTWALMSSPGQFEFLKNWTTLPTEKLRMSKKQPDRHVVVMSFFATWCGPCMKELPHLQKLFEKYGKSKVKFFLIDITEATRNSPGFETSPEAGPFLAARNITMPILNDNRGVAKERYGAKTLPRLFVIDKSQKIRMARQGFHEGENFEGEISALLDKLLVEEPK